MASRDSKRRRRLKRWPMNMLAVLRVHSNFIGRLCCKLFAAANLMFSTRSLLILRPVVFGACMLYSSRRVSRGHCETAWRSSCFQLYLQDLVESAWDALPSLGCMAFSAKPAIIDREGIFLLLNLTCNVRRRQPHTFPCDDSASVHPQKKGWGGVPHNEQKLYISTGKKGALKAPSF